MARVKRSCWIYQERQNDSGQWAIFIEADRDVKTRSFTMDATIYSEAIKNATRTISVHDINGSSVSEYVQPIKEAIKTFSTYEKEDDDQLESALLDILTGR